MQEAREPEDGLACRGVLRQVQRFGDGHVEAPFEDFEGDVKGVLGFDTLGMASKFDETALEMMGRLAAQTAEALKRIEASLSAQDSEAGGGPHPWRQPARCPGTP